MTKFHLIRTRRSTQASRALISVGPPLSVRMAKRPPMGVDSSRGMVAYGPAAGTRPMRTRPSSLENVSHWVSLPFGWTLAIKGKRREHHIRGMR
jgi:hypothetical protein